MHQQDRCCSVLRPSLAPDPPQARCRPSWRGHKGQAPKQWLLPGRQTWVRFPRVAWLWDQRDIRECWTGRLLTIAERTGKDRSTVTNFVRLLKLSPFVREALTSGQISVGHARTPQRYLSDGAQLRLAYRFEPGHVLDGVTATVPLHLLNQLDPASFEWLVPGLVREKVAQLFKALPKNWRRHLVPPAQHVTAFLQESGSPEVPSLLAAVTRYAHRAAGAPVPADAWERVELPPHLQMNFRGTSLTLAM